MNLWYFASPVLVRGLFCQGAAAWSRRAASTLPQLHQPTMSSKYHLLPKVELHVHADGACRLETLQELSRLHKLSYPHDDLEKFREVVTLTSAASSLAQFLTVFHNLTNILATKESLERIAYEFCEDSARQNVVYAEYRFNPFPLKAGADACTGEGYCDAILTGLDRGQADFKVKVRGIICIMREAPELAVDAVKLAEKFQSRGVVGVDIAGDELLPMDPRHIEGFKRARDAGLSITIHAAESGPASNVKQALELGAVRIGHGYHVLDDPDIYALAKEKKLHFEACPTSSVFTNSSSFEAHAVKHFSKDDVSFSLNTDDPGVINCTLTGEYDVAENRIGLNQHQIMRTVLCGAEAAFLPTEEKAELIKTVKQKLLEFDPTFQC